MAIALIAVPTTPIALYTQGAGVFQFKDEYAVTSVSNSSDDLRLNVGGIGAIVAVGEYVYYSPLETADNVESAVVLVTAIDTNFIVVATPFVAYGGSGVMRRMIPREFTIRTGIAANAAQPVRSTQTLEVRPDKTGIYSINSTRAGRTRLNFGAMAVTTASDYHHQISLSVYANEIGYNAAHVIILIKASVTGSPLLINYTNLRSLLSSFVTDKFIVKMEENKSSSVTLVEGATRTEVRLTGKEYSYLFDTGLQAISNLTWNGGSAGVIPIAGVEYRTSGTNTDGFTIPANLTADDINGSYTIANTSTAETWTVDFAMVQSFDSRETCANDVILVWWLPNGKWFTYAFNQNQSFFVDGNQATLTKDNNGQNLAVGYDKIYEAITLYAQPESETIKALLDTLKYSTQIFIVTTEFSGGAMQVDVDESKRVFVRGGGFEQKRIPFIAVDSPFQITVVRAEEINALNQ